jgi:hypothetical protein
MPRKALFAFLLGIPFLMTNCGQSGTTAFFEHNPVGAVVGANDPQASPTPTPDAEGGGDVDVPPTTDKLPGEGTVPPDAKIKDAKNLIVSLEAFTRHCDGDKDDDDDDQGEDEGESSDNSTKYSDQHHHCKCDGGGKGTLDSVVIGSWKIDKSAPKLDTKAPINFSKVKDGLKTGYGHAVLVLSLCDDTNANGSCLDEKSSFWRAAAPLVFAKVVLAIVPEFPVKIKIAGVTDPLIVRLKKE